MPTAPLAEQIAGVATLADPVRRSLYLYVVGRPTDVGRDEAARAATLAGVKRAARRLGKSLAVEARPRAAAGHGRPHLLRAAKTLLAEQGFAPQSERGGVIRLGNCPFAAVAREQQAVVCGTTLALVEGIVAGMELRGFEARAVPQNGSCCVAVMATKRSP